MYKSIDIKDINLKEIYNIMISGISPRPIAFVSSQNGEYLFRFQFSSNVYIPFVTSLFLNIFKEN